MAKNAEIIRAGPRQLKNPELFYALKTLSANDVEVENWLACSGKISAILCQAATATAVSFNVCKAPVAKFAVKQKCA